MNQVTGHCSPGPSVTLKGIQGEGQDEALCALGKLADPAFRQTFSGDIFCEPGFLLLSIFIKTPQTLTKVSVPHD